MLVPSPREVGTYDQKPEMSAGEVADRFCEELEQDGYSFAIVNFANPDMVGHTGRRSRPSSRRSRPPTPASAGWSKPSSALGGVPSSQPITATPRQMLEADGASPHTAHTSNPVPLIVTDPGRRARETTASSTIWSRPRSLTWGSRNPYR